MKNKLLIIFVAFSMVLSSLALTSCNKKGIGNAENDSDEQRSTTIEALEITDIPTEEKDIVKLFNQSIDNMRYYGNSYTKTLSRKITEIDVETLNTVSNSEDAFKSIFGQAELNYFYDYKKDKNDYLSNLPKGKIDDEEITSAEIEQNEDVIIITLEMIAVKNPTAECSFSKLCNDYISSENIQTNLKKFNSKSDVSTVTADNIKVVVKIDRLTSNLIEYSTEFDERFNLIGVSLVEIEGKDVTAKSKVRIVYDNFS